MKFRINLTEEDYIDYNIFAGMNNPNGKKALMTGRLYMPIFLLVALIVIWILKKDAMFVLFEGIFFVIVSIIWVAVYPKVYKGMIRKNILKLKKNGKLPFFESEDFELTDEEIIGTTETEIRRCRYENLNKIDVTADCIYVWIDAARAWIFPTRELGARRAEVLNLLNSKAPEKIVVR